MNKTESNRINFIGATCPIPLKHSDHVVMGHGSGGQMTQELIQQVFLPCLANDMLLAGNDFARASLPESANTHGHLIVSTDSHIVFPLFFRGGDIGRLAVCGTVNDISMSGAIPLFLSAGFIIEEGTQFEVLQRIAASMRDSLQEAGVQIIAADTKVVERGKGDGLFITTTGMGWLPDGLMIGGEKAQPGDEVLISGTIGDHGIAVMSARGEMGIEVDIQSDVAPLNAMIQAVLSAAPHTHVLRDPTRGGLATSLNEIATQSYVAIQLDEKEIPVQSPVRAACEMLGFDPMYIANEGKVIVIVPSNEAQAALDAMHRNQYGKNATRIGTVIQSPAKRLLMRTSIGGTRIIPVLAGEMLPRIC
jgi:hydrogenase expression/formation protein HypE